MLENNTIVITGANRGIGKSIAIECAKNGANLYLCSRKIDAEFIDFCQNLSSMYHNKVRMIELNLLKDESIKDAATEIIKDKSNIYGIVNNAGVSGFGRLFSMTTAEEIRQTFEVNFFGGMFLTQRLLKKIIKNRKGSIVNISSISAIDGYPGQFEYVASKAALLGATRQMAYELGRFGIRVNAVAPGIADTDMILDMATDLKSDSIDHTVLKKLISPEDISRMVVFLLSDKSSSITGQTIRVDGGKY